MNKIEALIKKGVRLPNPQSVEIGDDINIDRIAAKGVVLHAGSKLLGKDTFIAEGVTIGYEAPVTIENCYIGPDVALHGGFFQRAVFLKGVVCGSGSHVRGGTILEEHSSIAHTVGLKQTILLPYVTLGSLINFCDCLMAGGTSRENHSEVGSAYIHFNYTPNQDKATPSLIGDVPRGVMLNQHPIFLGGQGGLVGPCRIAYGTIIGAGSLCRKDQLDENRLVFEGCSGKGSLPFKAGVYRTIQRILHNNFYYLGNLIALHQWYRNVRARFVGSQMPAPLYQGLLATLDMAYEERIKQFLRLAGKMQDTAGQNVLQRKFKENSLLIEKKLRELYDSQGDQGLKKQFLEVLERNTQPSEPVYLETIHRLSIKEALIGTAWLDSIVRNMLENMIEILPTLKV